MTAISRQTPEFYTDHPTQNIYGKKNKNCYITLRTLIVSTYSYHRTNLTYIGPNTGFVLSQWSQLSPVLYLLLVVQVCTTIAGFIESSNWAPHLLRLTLTMYIYIGKCFKKILIWDHWTIWHSDSKLYLNAHWLVLYKMYVFCVISFSRWPPLQGII